MRVARSAKRAWGTGATFGVLLGGLVPIGCGGDSAALSAPVTTPTDSVSTPSSNAATSALPTMSNGSGTDAAGQPASSADCADPYSCCGLGEAGIAEDGSRYCVGVTFCNADSECPLANGGSATPTCESNGDVITQGASGHCVLPCSDTLTCPGGMQCLAARCVFVTAAASEGSSTPLPVQGPLPEGSDTTPDEMSLEPAEGLPSVPSTRGSGGPIGPADLTSKGGLSFKIDAPASDVPRGLLILLHGSTASNYDRFIGLMRDVASEYDLIPVSVLAPNGQGWNEGNQVAAAELLHRLVQEDLYALYDIDTTRVLFSGQSSGGGFLASNFIPAHAQDYHGGAFLQCGAAPPNIPFMPTAETRQSFRLHFEITTGDPIWPEYYAAAITAYSNAQMLFTMDDTKPGGHCQFDQQQVILDHIDVLLGGAAASP
jgi:hypothetical protein